ncbi:MAG: 3-dehydroquinate synthase, partial [Myxococcota bacterium]|nr:3-dehydroquinate synthase [Myxococcota bacterium]
MSVLTVELGERSYPIHLIDELPGPTVAAEARRLRPAPAPVLVVTDDHVGPLYADGVCQALDQAGYASTCVTLPHGEATKRLEVVSSLVDDALAAGLSRQDLIVALGGGVVGDVAGFTAAVL